jgi:hypothetical protein
MKFISRVAIISVLLGVVGFAFAQDFGESLIDPPVTVTNHTNQAIEVVTYSDFPHIKRIIKHNFVIPAMQSKTDKSGIDYYAKAHSGMGMDQANRVVVMIFDHKTNQLIAAKSKVVDTYGSQAIEKDKKLKLEIKLSPGQDIDISML